MPLWRGRGRGGDARRAVLGTLRAKVLDDALVDGHLDLVFLLDERLHTFRPATVRRGRAAVAPLTASRQQSAELWHSTHQHVLDSFRTSHTLDRPSEGKPWGVHTAHNIAYHNPALPACQRPRLAGLPDQAQDRGSTSSMSAYGFLLGKVCRKDGTRGLKEYAIGKDGSRGAIKNPWPTAS